MMIVILTQKQYLIITKSIYIQYMILFDTWTLKLRTGIEYLALSPRPFAVDYNYDYSKEEYLKFIPCALYRNTRSTMKHTIIIVLLLCFSCGDEENPQELINKLRAVGVDVLPKPT